MLVNRWRKSEQIRGNHRKSPETRWRLSSIVHLVWRPFLGHCGRVSVRGSRSIPQGFLKGGSNFLPLGTPLLARLSQAHRKAL
jgi:hypothetical protein